MTWLTWRQFRTQAVSVWTAAALIALALAVTGPGLRHASHTDGTNFLPGLHSRSVQAWLYLLGLAQYAVPAVIGAFWGAPLIARELEAGTHRLVWTQSVSRNRWLAAKLGFTGLATLVTAGGLSLAVTWWSSPIDRAVAGPGSSPTAGSRRWSSAFAGWCRSRSPGSPSPWAWLSGCCFGAASPRWPSPSLWSSPSSWPCRWSCART